MTMTTVSIESSSQAQEDTCVNHLTSHNARNDDDVGFNDSISDYTRWFAGTHFMATHLETLYRSELLLDSIHRLSKG